VRLSASSPILAGTTLGNITQVEGTGNSSSDRSGNPLNVFTGNSTVNGVINTLRPDVTGPVQSVGSVDRWFDTRPFVAVNRNGNLGLNVIIGPGFSNVDFSLLKNTKLSERLNLQFRTEVFDVFNHPSFGQPGRIVGTPGFGRVTNTRFPTGDSGSSRQLQFALKLMF